MPLPSVPRAFLGRVSVYRGWPGMSSIAHLCREQAAGMGPAGVPRAPEVPVLPQDPRSAHAVSPFSLPMPEFGATFPSFEAGVPVLPPLAPLRDEDDAKSALTTASPFYFLENAGGMSAPVAAPGPLNPNRGRGPGWACCSLIREAPQSLPFRLPMPEFDDALFPSFEAGVPKLAPLPPLRNENDARAALTDPSSFYFLEGSGLTATKRLRRLHDAQRRRILRPWPT